MSKKILGIGNAIVDVFVKVDDNFLLKNNLTKGSMKLIEKQEFESLKKSFLCLVTQKISDKLIAISVLFFFARLITCLNIFSLIHLSHK